MISYLGVDNAQMEVDKEDLEEAKDAVAFAEKIGVFDKTPPTDKTPPQVSKPSIQQDNWDKLVADMAKVKANQEEIKKKLDLVLQFKKKVDLFLQILTKKEQEKNDNDSNTTADEFLYPPTFQFLVKRIPPWSYDGLVMMVELKHGCHELLPSEV